MPITRINLCPRPSLSTGQPAQQWAFPSGWTRSTGLDASLPRQTGLAGNTANADIYSAIGPCVAGRSYVGSISLRSIGINAGNVQLVWHNLAGNELARTALVPFSQGANTTVRLGAGPAVAPVGAIAFRIAVMSLDTSAQLTAALLEQATALGGAYFDGDGPDAGARWTGLSGRSPSVVGTNTPSGDITYDDLAGRVRVFMFGGSALGGSARVLYRPITRTALTLVRGGNIATVGGATVRSADDYEFSANTPILYIVDNHPGTDPLPANISSSDVVNGVVTQFGIPPIESVTLPFTPPVARGWLKFVAAPALNRKVTVLDWSAVERPSRNSTYEVRDREDPVVVTAGHSSRRLTLTLRTWTSAETDQLDESMKQGVPGFLHMPDNPDVAAPPTMYCVFGPYSWVRPSRRSVGAVFTVPLVEVAAPAASIFARGATWQTVLDTYPTWGDVLAVRTWQELTS